jgi:hypothetical protein
MSVLCCADAGADFSTYVNEHTGYDLVQDAANAGQFEAVVKLVEAGASWRLGRGQARVGANGSIFYVPEILSVQKPGIKVRFGNTETWNNMHELMCVVELCGSSMLVC